MSLILIVQNYYSDLSMKSDLFQIRIKSGTILTK